MKKVIKLLTICLVAFSTLFVVTACSGGDDGGDGHTHDYTASTQVVTPTCKNEGYTKHICSCGEFIVDNKIPLAVHVLDKDRKCQNCDKKASEGLRIVGTELRALSNCSDTEIIVPKGVTSIYNGAFKNKTEITAIYIPKTVTQIGDNAFLNCSNLKKVIFEENSQIEFIGFDVFKDCDLLEYLEVDGGLYIGTSNDPLVCMGAKDENVVSISIADGTRIINSKAFYKKTTLNEISVPNSIVCICEGAFLFSSNINKAIFRGTYNEWANIKFIDTYSTPAYYAGGLIAEGIVDGVLTLSSQNINNYAFTGCLNFSKIILTDSVENVGACAFACCYNIRELIIGSGLKNVDAKAFENCYKLIEVLNNSSLNLTLGSLDNGNIATYAKNIYKTGNGSSKLTQKGDFIYFPFNGKDAIFDYVGESAIVTLPSDSTLLAKYALYKKEFITKLIIPEGIKEIDDYACAGLKGITQIDIPNSLEKIGKYSFEGCSKVTAINFGTQKNLKYIDDYAFSELSSIETIILPDGVKRTGHYSFANCTNLKVFSLPSSISELAWRIFNGCHLLTDITFRGLDCRNDDGRVLHELAQNTYYDNGTSYYFWWYYQCGTSYVKFPRSNGFEEGEYNFEQKGR